MISFGNRKSLMRDIILTDEKLLPVIVCEHLISQMNIFLN